MHVATLCSFLCFCPLDTLQRAAYYKARLERAGKEVKAVHPSEYDEGGEAMREEFRAFLILLLDMLESGETARAIAKIREILDK